MIYIYLHYIVLIYGGLKFYKYHNINLYSTDQSIFELSSDSLLGSVSSSFSSFCTLLFWLLDNRLAPDFFLLVLWISYSFTIFDRAIDLLISSYLAFGIWPNLCYLIIHFYFMRILYSSWHRKLPDCSYCLVLPKALILNSCFIKSGVSFSGSFCFSISDFVLISCM